MIAIHTPVKRAAAVSPLEALRYSDYQGKMKESSVLHRKITPASLAKMNLSRQKEMCIRDRVNEVRAKEGSNIKGVATVVCGDWIEIT